MIHERRDVHEWLIRVLGQAELVIETGGVIVHFGEDTGKGGPSRRTDTLVRSLVKIGDVRLVVGRVGVVSVPAALEVLGDNK